MLAYLFAILIGFTLGLLGGGGSILTVPVLVYFLSMDAKLSIALSLAIVGSTSLIGVFGHTINKNIDFKVASIFAPIAMIGTFLGAKLSVFMSGELQLFLFAVIMILASILMFRPLKNEDQSQIKINYYLLFIQALVVGVITGVVGVGGGFLIVPALVLLAGLNMKKAVGTSLLIIALNSLSGFIGYLGTINIPWDFLIKFIIFSAIGTLIGSNMVKFVSQRKLKKSFAIFLIIMGSFVLYKNIAILS